MKSLPPTIFTLSLLMFGLLLSACSSAQASDLQRTPALTVVPYTPTSSDPSQVTSASPLSQSGASWPDGQAQQDAQGAVEVAIIPLNLNNPGGTLDFEVSLNTHSIDLSMDLAALATLVTDSGKTVQASLWDAPLGGHHVSGVLSFPADVDGASFLEGATRLTLTLSGLDVPERVFNWDR